MAWLIGPISGGQAHLRQNSALLHSRCCLSITMGAGANICERQNSRNRIRCDLENIGNAFCKGSFKKDINIPIYPALHLNSSSTQIQSTKQITKLLLASLPQNNNSSQLYFTNWLIYFPNNIQDAFLYYLCYPPPHRRHCPRCSSRPDSQELYVILFPPLYSWNYPANSTQATLRLENARLSALSLLRLLLLFPLQPRLLARMWR